MPLPHHPGRPVPGRGRSEDERHDEPDPRDAERRVVSIRLHGKAENAGEMPFDAFVAALVSDYRTRASETLVGKITPAAK